MGRNFPPRARKARRLLVEADGYPLDRPSSLGLGLRNLTFTSDHGLDKNCDAGSRRCRRSTRERRPRPARCRRTSASTPTPAESPKYVLDLSGGPLRVAGLRGTDPPPLPCRQLALGSWPRTRSRRSATRAIRGTSTVVDHNNIYSNNFDPTTIRRCAHCLGLDGGGAWVAGPKAAMSDTEIFDNWRRGVRFGLRTGRTVACPEPPNTPHGSGALFRA